MVRAEWMNYIEQQKLTVQRQRLVQMTNSTSTRPILSDRMQLHMAVIRTTVHDLLHCLITSLAIVATARHVSNFGDPLWTLGLVGPNWSPVGGRTDHRHSISFNFNSTASYGSNGFIETDILALPWFRPVGISGWSGDDCQSPPLFDINHRTNPRGQKFHHYPVHIIGQIYTLIIHRFKLFYAGWRNNRSPS